ncbi:MAG: hypothetical protein AB9903_06595 [Vulcanimicrobiota bacterium]
MILCVRCGTANFEGDGACVKCCAALPRIPPALRMMEQKRGHLEQLENAGRELQEGTLSLDGFRDILLKIEERVAASVNNLKNMSRDKVSDGELQALLDEEYSLALEGSEMMLAAVGEMSLYIGHHDPDNYFCEDYEHSAESHLENGVSIARTATETINSSLEISREIRKVLDLPLTHETETMV